MADPAAEAKIAAAYATDPGASADGRYMNASAGVAAAGALGAGVRLMVVGNRHDCAAPIPDFYPSGTPRRTFFDRPRAFECPAACHSHGVGISLSRRAPNR